MDPITMIGMAMQNDQQAMRAISQNVANVTTPGFKREISVAAPLRTGSAGALVRDASAGTLRPTGNPLDLALEGEGYFEVMTAAGPAYTRQAALKIDGHGRLVDGRHARLMGADGELWLTPEPVQIDQAGEVRQGGRRVGRIKVVRFADPQLLRALGDGLYAADGVRVDGAAAAGRVRSGHQENSNVNAPREMVRMTETVRHFETMQKLMQGYEEAFDKAMRKLGEF